MTNEHADERTNECTDEHLCDCGKVLKRHIYLYRENPICEDCWAKLQARYHGKNQRARIHF